MAWELVLRHPDAEESSFSSTHIQRIFSRERQCSPRGLGGANMGSAPLEADFDILAMGGIDLPELPIGKIENPRDDDIRELLQAGVVDGHRGVVKFSAVGDLILDLADPVAQLAEAGIGFQIGRAQPP